MKHARHLSRLSALLLGAIGVSAQPVQRDTTVTLPREGEWSRAEVAGEAVAVRLEAGEARVTAGATFRALRIRLLWHNASGTVRLRAAVPPELTRLLSPSSNSPR